MPLNIRQLALKLNVMIKPEVLLVQGQMIEFPVMPASRVF